jgi:CO/xanthine dehydrogenase Mo-binding subunit
VEEVEQLHVIGKSVPRVDALAKVLGKAIYSDDLVLPHLLHGKALHSSHPHAQIVKLDVSKAKALSGVHAVLTAEDVQNNNRYHRTGDTWVLAEREVRFIGDIIAVVAAENENIAEEAVCLIDVEYQPLPAVAAIKHALTGDHLARNDKSNNIAMSFSVSRGDVELDFETAEVFVSGKYVFPSLHQLHLEPNSATAVYELGKLVVYCASQVWFRTRHELAKMTGVAEENVIVKAMGIGGAFGARNEQIVPILAALLALAAKRPVKFTNTRLEEFLATRPSVGMEIELSIAADRDGNLLSKKAKVFADFGAFTSDSDAVLGIASLRADNNYNFKSVYVESMGLYTNHAPTSAYRGFGNPQMHFALESLIDELARKLEMDPSVLRLQNFIKPNRTGIHGYQVSSCGLEECMAKAKALIDWDERRKNKTPGKGLGVAALIHVSSSRAGEPEFAGSCSMLRLDSNRKFTVFVGECEMGQGACTVMAQIVAEEFGISPQEVTVIMGDTDLTPFSTGTHGSKLTTNLGNSMLFACKEVKEKLTKCLREYFGMGPIDIKDGNIIRSYTGEFVMTLAEGVERASYANSGRPFIGLGVFEPKTVMLDQTGYGHIAPTYSFGIQIAEVTVLENGYYVIDKVISVHDIGRVVNQQMALGQVYGGVMQAIGSATLEDLSVNQQGIYRANSILEYKPPTILEMPELVGGFVETVDPYGPYGAKGIAECPNISVAPAVANAIYDACGLRFTDIPVTPIKIRQKMIEAKRNKQKGEAIADPIT